MEPGSVEGLVHRLATNRLIEAVGRERVFPYATNLPLARRLAAAMRLGIYLAPLPHFYGPPAAPVAPPPLPPGAGPLIASVGVPRARKLGVPLPDIVRAALSRRPDLRFVIQVNEIESNGDLMALEKLRQVKLVKGWLEDDAFAALIQAAAALLLPYRRDRYAENISSPFAFAAAYGRPAIVPSGTWMAERIARKQAAGVAYKRDEAVIDAIAVTLDRQAQLLAQASKLAERWRIWDGKALLRVVRQWAAGEGTAELRLVLPKPLSPAAPPAAS
jgi:glycosyltransferase involved in cell wall biosynthesis